MTNSRFDFRSHFFGALVVVAALTVGLSALLSIMTSLTTDTSISQPAGSIFDVVDYRDGGWWSQGSQLPVNCPQEDTCEVLTEADAADWADTSDATGATHSGCVVIISDTSVVVCLDGYYSES
jgi:hypothetical protein